MNSTRTKRINSEIQKQIYAAINKFVCESHNGIIVSVTKVDVTDDLAECKVFLSVFSVAKSFDTKAILNEINNKNKEIREYVAHNVNLRIMPVLRFILDAGVENSIKVESILSKINNKE